MDLFSNISYVSPILYLKTKNEAEDIFGVAHSFVKSLWVLKEYESKGGLIDAEEKFGYKDYRFVKGNIEVSCIGAGKLAIHNQISYAESFVDHEKESVADCARKSVDALRKLVDEDFKKKTFEEVYSSLVFSH